MAKLPTYEQKAPLMAGIDTFQTPNLQEQIRRSKSIEGSLDVISKFAAGQAEIGIKKQAAQYTVANPLTTKQLEDAQATGVNPIEAALNGGMIWNDAVQKLYAQQATSELTNSAYKHYEDVYERVKNGQLTDAAVIQQELETPLKSWSNVIAQIDPKSANEFYQRRITDGNTYYKASLKELRGQEQVRQDGIAQDTMYGLIKQFELDVQNQEPGVVFAKYVNGMKEANGLFQNSPHQATYKSKIEQEFTKALLRNIAIGVQGEYGTVNEALERLDKNDLGKYSEVWKNLTPSQKDTLQVEIIKRYNKIDTQNRATLKSVTDAGKDIRDGIINGTNPDDYVTALTQYNTQANNLSGEYKQAAEADMQMTEAMIKISNKFRYLKDAQIESYINQMPTGPIKDIAIKHQEKLLAGRNKDLAAFTLSRNDVTTGDINLFYGNDPQQLKASFNEQFSLISSHPNYKSGQTNLLTKAQTNDLVNFLASDTGKVQKAQVAYNIVAAFGEESVSILNEIAPKDPVFARIGGLVLESPDAKSVIDKIMTGQALIDNKQVGGKLKSTRMSDTSLRVTKALEFADPKNIESVFAAADAYYVAMGGDTENIIDTKLYDQALVMVTGGMFDGAGNQYGGFAKINDDVVFIDNNIRADLVDDYVSTAKYNDFTSSRITDLTEDQMMQYSDNIDIVDPQGIPYSETDLNRATLKQTTDGYVLSDENGNPFADQNGRLYLFDINTLQEIYNNKRMYGQPDAKVTRSRYTETSDPRLRSNLPESELKIKPKKGTGRGK